MTISIDNQVLRLGVPVLLLSLILIFILINKKALSLVSKTSSFKYYIAITITLSFSVVIAYFNNMPLGSSISAMLKVFLMGGFFVLGFILALYGKLKVSLFIITSSVLWHLLAGISGYFLGIGDDIHGVLRPTGIAGKVNVLANLALFSAVFYGARGFLEKQNRFALLTIMFMSLCMIFFSGTLKNVIALFGAVAVYAFLGSNRKFLTISVFLALFVPVSIGLALYTPIGDRIIEAFVAGIDVEVEEGQKLESSLQWRVLHWKLLFDDWLARFFWQGAGFGQVGNMNALKTESGVGFVAHSDWLQFWVELGPVLFIFFIYFHFKLLRPVYKMAREGESLAFGLFFAFIAQVIAMLAGPVYFSVSFFYYFWLLLGMLAAKEFRDNQLVKAK
ncbi:O-antigen ligase [Thalassotalea sp. PP2-459]|uniref:O-antigen ligase family protein n=1 Tax=Thalassotalea sp. PP2-459 TaxID=1742724 RepID=UPI0009438950|nr:O-antigen ligase family protein [Thalassotalea sp. PP2-459]OKY24644.1 hypothetical protein BI291_05475 [Thalassotalea sp. PP2-459]